MADACLFDVICFPLCFYGLTPLNSIYCDLAFLADSVLYKVSPSNRFDSSSYRWFLDV